MTASWVIGSGGLLGAGLARVLDRTRSDRFQPPWRFEWSNGERLNEQLSLALSAFAQQARAIGSWEIYWAAGVGTLGASESELAPETSAWSHLLRSVGAHPVMRGLPGRVALASSAGAIYAASTAEVISEACSIAPTTPYAHAKLEQERLLAAFSESGVAVSSLIARISTLYGPGQTRSKRPGLIAHMARAIVRHRPIQIFVPFDTVRDYINADDAAAAMVVAMRCIPPLTVLSRIVASEQPTSIAEIVATFRRIAHRPVLISTSASRLSSLYLRRVRFRSIHPLGRPLPHTTLPIGISQVLAAEREVFACAVGAALRRTS